jgi:hypothetical protein
MVFRPDPKPEPKPKKKYSLPLRKTPIAKQSLKNRGVRLERRADLPGFYEALIAAANKAEMYCDNCGAVIRKPDSSNFAHILSKRIYVEVQTHPKNILRLCGMWDAGKCHQDFDSCLSQREVMPVFKKAVDQIREIRHMVTTWGKEIEQIDNYKMLN